MAGWKKWIVGGRPRIGGDVGLARPGLSRRAFLGGAGVAVTLPFMASLLPRALWRGSAARAAGPEGQGARLVFMYVPNGMHMPSWRPPGATLDEGSLPKILRPLGALASEALVVSNIANRPAQPDGPGDHAAGTGGFLTCVHVRKTEGDNIEAGVSADQLAAARLGEGLLLPSLELGIEGGSAVGGCDSGYSCAYARNISWAGPKTPRPKLTQPQLVFDRLFQGFEPGDTAEARERRKRGRRSVLDFVASEAQTLSTRVGASDRRKLDEYLTGVRELERKIDTVTDSCLPPDRAAAHLDVQAHVDAMIGLTAVAFRCDLTRVVTFMLANAGSNRSYAFVDPSISGGHHDISHHQGAADNFRMLEIIGAWEVAQVAAMGRALQAIEDDEERTALDNTLIYLSSEISDGDRHNHDDLPVLMLGRLGGAVRPGRHVALPQEGAMADLFMEILEAVGVAAPEFGDDGTAPMGVLT